MQTPTTNNYQHQLMTMRTALLAQIAEQRGGIVSRADVAADHFGRRGQWRTAGHRTRVGICPG
ncbi:hypothetical protein [Rhodoferax sp. AJA081-3]|uniref:hypothetical protein n=1 Tax=Rhodoferax sp. AJA081-3 TaxID=2752316 RepID=UPI0035305293